MTSNFLLLLSAMIWGFAFVAQSSVNSYMGPFTFIGIRFALGALFVFSYILFKKRFKITNIKSLLIGGLLCGTVLFLGMSLQQISLFTVSVGKAGFITGQYVILVPIFGIVLKHKTNIDTWIGAIIAVVGLYLLCMKNESFYFTYGEILLLISTALWGIHVHLIGHFSPKVDASKLAVMQFVVCSIFSFITALFFEKMDFSNLDKSIFLILYTGILSTGVAWTLQIFVQKKTSPSRSAIIMSTEAVFAVIGGWIFLSEKMHYREIIGCLLMFGGMIISQYRSKYEN